MFNRVQMMTAVGARQDKGKALRDYCVWLVNRMYRGNDRSRAIAINAIAQAKDSAINVKEYTI